MRMTSQQRFYKGVLFALMTGVYLGGYLLINNWLASRGLFHDLTLPYEARLPFIPFFVLGYIAYFGVFICLYLKVEHYRFFKRAVLAFLICIILHFWIFILFPVKYTLRPVIDPLGSIFLSMTDYFYWIDPPFNCFPSIHVSNTILGVLILHRYEKKHLFFWLCFVLFVSASVIFIKQHYLLDVLAAIPMAIFANWIAFFGLSDEDLF